MHPAASVLSADSVVNIVGNKKDLVGGPEKTSNQEMEFLTKVRPLHERK